MHACTPVPLCVASNVRFRSEHVHTMVHYDTVVGLYSITAVHNWVWMLPCTGPEPWVHVGDRRDGCECCWAACMKGSVLNTHAAGQTHADGGCAIISEWLMGSVCAASVVCKQQMSESAARPGPMYTHLGWEWNRPLPTTPAAGMVPLLLCYGTMYPCCCALSAVLRHKEGGGPW